MLVITSYKNFATLDIYTLTRNGEAINDVVIEKSFTMMELQQVCL